MNDKQKPSIRFKGFTEAWEQRKLGDVVQITMGQSPDGSTYSDIPSNYILVQGNADLEDGWVKPRVWTTQITKQADVGDLIMSVRAPAGAMGKTAYNAVIGRGVAAIKGNEFIYQLLVKMDKEGYWKKDSTGSTFESLNSESIKNAEIKFPSSEEQKKIGAYFNNLDYLITLHQRKYDKLVNVKKSMLEKMFPRDGKNVPEIRFSGFTEAWEQRKLSEIATMHARIGWQNLRTSEFLDSGNYMLITGTDFEDGAINFDTCHYVERERYEQDKHIQIKNGSILITKDGTLGKVAYVQGLSMPATLNAGVFNVEIKDETKVDNKYLFQYLKAPYLMDYVDKKATGGTIKHLNQNILVDFPVVMPLKQEQRLIGAYFNQLDNLITLHQRKYNKLLNVKKSMLEKMFPKNGSNIPEIRFKGFTDPWEQRKLLSCIEKITDFRGRTPKKLGMDWSESGYLALSALNVKDGYIDFSQDVHYGEQALYDKWMSGNELHKGQVLFTTEAPMGNVAQVPDNKRYILSQRTIAFDVKEDIITENFLATLLRSPAVFNTLTSLSSGGTAKGVSQKSLAGVDIQIPVELREQELLATYFANLDNLITLHQREF